MMKKTYICPKMEVVTIKTCELLAGSGPDQLFDVPVDGNESLAPGMDIVITPEQLLGIPSF